jgi:hypothetical protein
LTPPGDVGRKWPTLAATSETAYSKPARKRRHVGSGCPPYGAFRAAFALQTTTPGPLVPGNCQPIAVTELVTLQIISTTAPRICCKYSTSIAVQKTSFLLLLLNNGRDFPSESGESQEPWQMTFRSFAASRRRSNGNSPWQGISTGAVARLQSSRSEVAPIGASDIAGRQHRPTGLNVKAESVQDFESVGSGS